MDQDKYAAQTADNSARCSREKYWRECSIEEKIERLRQIVKTMQRDQALIGELAQTASDQLTEHKHAEGKVLVPLRSSHGGYLARASQGHYAELANSSLGHIGHPDDVYF